MLSDAFRYTGHFFFLSPPPSIFCWLLCYCYCLMITQLLLPSEHQSSKQKEEGEDGFTIWQTLFTFYRQKPGNMSIFRSRENELTRTGLDQLWSFSEPHSLSSRNIRQYLKKSAFRQQRKRPGEARGWENNSWCLLLNSLQKLTIIE